MRLCAVLALVSLLSSVAVGGVRKVLRADGRGADTDTGGVRPACEEYCIE